MLDYVFFDDGGLGRFVAFLEEHRIASEQRDDSLGGRIVSVAEDLPDEILDAVGDRYDVLMAEQSAMAELDESLVKTRVVGIQVSLADGSLRTVELDAAIGNLLLARFTPGEAQRLVEAIARSLEIPGDGPLCRKRSNA